MSGAVVSRGDRCASDSHDGRVEIWRSQTLEQIWFGASVVVEEDEDVAPRHSAAVVRAEPRRPP